ncbi:MAG: formate dehydrogenase subunit alpha, partial [Proteobacteria bacterium]|nr:formate dehydrogenase subunit alpha [Pseudomonadota bacterium]
MAPMSDIRFELNGKQVEASADESLLDVCKRLELDVPHLCYHPDQRADGNCRACVVEIEGERTLAPSCRREPTEGMVVHTNSQRAKRAQSGVLDLLETTLSGEVYTRNDELRHWQARVGGNSEPGLYQPGQCSDNSHPAIDFNPDACILCTRCVRACREVQVNDIIGISNRGGNAQVVFDLHDPLGDSRCVACGECVQACPTGALSNKGEVDLLEADKQINSVCPYCGVGCQLTYHVRDGRIVKVDGRDGPANHNRLCVKGRYGFDYVHHPERLTRPLIRRTDVPKGLNEFFDPSDPGKMFREVSWDEALDFAADSLLALRENIGFESLAGFGSAKGSNEEAYLFQKLVRTVFGNNNVDHCTRLCHASSVAALLEGVGSGGVSNQVEDVQYADLILVIGSNTTSNHPVAATFIKQQQQAGKTLVVIDPRRIELAVVADHFLQFKPDSDVALLNALLFTIIDEQLIDEDFIEQRTTDFELIRQNVADFSPENMAPVCGIPAEKIRQVARLYAGAENAIIFWGMGVSQHIHGTDNVRCLISLCMLCGQIGRPGSGLHPLRGQNNVQGASDAGLIPMMYPDYQRVDNEKAQKKFETAWKTVLDTKPGLTVVEIMHAIHAGTIRGMYIMGENPAMSDPNLNETRAALAKLEHLVVQDIFLTETAAFADVVLPAAAWPEKTGTVTNTDRRVQKGRQAVEPPGEAMPDSWITQQIGIRMGHRAFNQSLPEVFEEMRSLMPSISGISWDRVEAQDSVTYPCADEKDSGQGVVFIDRFPTESGKARLVPARLIPADEQPNTDFPFVLITGRLLEHWHTGAMTRRARVLNEIEPVPMIDIHPDDLQQLGLDAGQMVCVESRRGKLMAHVR